MGKDLEAKFEAAANLIAKGTPTKGSASTDEAWHEALCQGRSRASPSLSPLSLSLSSCGLESCFLKISVDSSHHTAGFSVDAKKTAHEAMKPRTSLSFMASTSRLGEWLGVVGRFELRVLDRLNI